MPLMPRPSDKYAKIAAEILGTKPIKKKKAKKDTKSLLVDKPLK